MKLKRIITSTIAAVGVLAAPLLTSSFVFANGLTCTWTGASDTTFSNVNNWSGCNSGVPGTGDNLVFDNTTIPSTGSILVDDLGSVTFANVTFSGSGANSYDITPSTGSVIFGVSGTLTDSTSTAGAQLDLPVTLSGASPSISAANVIQFGDSATNYAMSMTGANVSILGDGEIDNYEPITNASNDTLAINMGAGGVFSQQVASPAFLGSLSAVTGKFEEKSTATTLPDMLSAASSIGIGSNATVEFNDPSATAGTVAEPFTIVSGTGTPQCTDLTTGNTVNCGAVFANLAAGSNLNFTGAIHMVGDTQFNSNDTITVSGPLSGNFKLTNAVGTLVVQSSNNTSGTANGTYAATNSLTAGTAAVKTAAAKVKAPKTPDTGLGAIAANPAIVLGASIAAAGLILAVSRKLSFQRN